MVIIKKLANPSTEMRFCSVSSLLISKVVEKKKVTSLTKSHEP